MNPTMNIGVGLGIVIHLGLNYGLRLEGGCGIIKVNQVMTVNFLVKYREFLPDFFNIELNSRS